MKGGVGASEGLRGVLFQGQGQSPGQRCSERGPRLASGASFRHSPFRGREKKASAGSRRAGVLLDGGRAGDRRGWALLGPPPASKIETSITKIVDVSILVT